MPDEDEIHRQRIQGRKFLPINTGPHIHWFHQGCGGRMARQTLLWKCEKCLEEGFPDREWYMYAADNPTTIQFGKETIEVCLLVDVEPLLEEGELPESGRQVN